MTKNEKMRARYIFDNKKDVNTLYMTSDSQFFVTESAANAHSKELKDTSVEPVSRAEAETVITEVDNNNAVSYSGTFTVAEGVLSALEQVAKDAQQQGASAENAGADVKTEVSENTGSGAATPSGEPGAEENTGSGAATPSGEPGAEENKGSGTATPADPLLGKTKTDLKKLLTEAKKNRDAAKKDGVDVAEIDAAIAKIEAVLAAKK